MSFADSLKNSEDAVEVSVATASLSTSSSLTANENISAYNLDDELEENWVKPVNYNTYDYYNGEYNDSNISTIDTNKNVTLDATQINLTQESNSQYIPFQMPRYYDGFDLSTTNITIWWTNKLWFADLGDEACKDLVAYTHEEINVQMCGFKRKYLSDNSGKRSSMSFLCSHILRNKKAINSTYSNEGGWATSTLNTWLNNRFYNGLPLQIKQLVKQVKVQSSIGNQSNELSTSNCYIYIPALIELNPSTTEEPYINEDSTIEYIVNNSDRIRKDHTGTAVEYWTRSPNVGYTSYFYYIQGVNGTSGSVNGFGQPPSEYGVVFEFSI